MNEVTYEEPRPEAVRTLAGAITTQQASGPLTAEQLAHNFLVQVQRDIDDQVDQRVQQRLAAWKGPAARSGGDVKDVAIASLIVGMLLTITKASDLGVGGIAIVWGAIIAINVLWAIAWLFRR